MCECIVILRGFKEINWKTAKGMMAETNFLSSLQNMDVDGISQGQVGVCVCVCVRERDRERGGGGWGETCSSPC